MQQKDFGVIQTVCPLKISNYPPAPPCSSLSILYAVCLWIFEWKIEECKERKELFFCKLNTKDGNVFYRYIYIEREREERERQRDRGRQREIERYIWQFFSQGEHRDRLNPSAPPVCFHLLFKEPLPLHNKPFIKKRSLKEMKGVNDDASAFMHLNIKANK